MSNSQPLVGIRILAALNSPELFGHERGNLEVFKALRKGGAEVCVGVTTLCDSNAVKTEIEKLGFSSFPIPFGFQWSKKFFTRRPFLLIENLIRGFRSNRAFAAQIRSFQPTHVHLGNCLTYTYLSFALRRSGVPLVVRVGDAPPIASPLQMAIWRRFMAASCKVVAISDYLRRFSAEACEELQIQEASVIHSCAPTGGADSAPASFDSRFRHVVYVGQIIREKGVFEFVRAASLLAARFPKVQFHFVGGSVHSREIERDLIALVAQLGLSDLTTFHGWVDNTSEFFEKASVHVVPSLCQEGLGNVVLEAKRAGTPSVVFPSGGLPEMIRHEIDGYICPDTSPEAMAAGIEWVLNRTLKLRKDLRAEVAADYQERFGADRFRAAWTEVYLENLG